MFRSSNPVLKEGLFSSSGAFADGQSMTIQGTVNKALIMLAILLVGAAWVWQGVMPLIQAAQQGAVQAGTLAQGKGMVLPFVFGGAIVGFLLALVISFKPQWSGLLAPVYALAEGVFIGGFSAFIEFMYPGLILQAVMLTFGTLFCLLMAYKTGLIRVTDKLRLGIMVATGAIALIYIVNMVMGFFHASIPFVHGSGFFGIAFSFFVVGIAALSLVLDFDFIERGAEAGAPKYMEWFGAFALMVTLVWLYMEIVRLLMKLRDR